MAERDDTVRDIARILIVDDHPLMREALATRVATEGDLEVCGQAADVSEALQQVAATDPDLVIADLSLKSGNGFDLIKQIKARSGHVKILIHSMYEESRCAEPALRSGAMGFISKLEAPRKIIEAVRQVLAGRVYLSSKMTERVLNRTVGGDRGTAGFPAESLTDRELGVFELIGQGQTTRGIADRLGLSVHTIDTCRERIKLKLNLKSGAELDRYAVIWVLEDE